MRERCPECLSPESNEKSCRKSPKIKTLWSWTILHKTELLKVSKILKIVKPNKVALKTLKRYLYPTLDDIHGEDTGPEANPGEPPTKHSFWRCQSVLQELVKVLGDYLKRSQSVVKFDFIEFEIPSICLPKRQGPFWIPELVLR